MSVGNDTSSLNFVKTFCYHLENMLKEKENSGLGK